MPTNIIPFVVNTHSEHAGSSTPRALLAPSANETERLEGLLTRRLGSRIRGLRLVFEQTGVILRGCSETYHAKQVAQHAVREFTAAPILANEIEVQ